VVDQRRRYRQLAVFLGGLLALNFPLLGLVDAIRLPGGVPLTPLYLFAVWLGLILLTAAIAGRPGSGR
jgi:hypothetical protein